MKINRMGKRLKTISTLGVTVALAMSCQAAGDKLKVIDDFSEDSRTAYVSNIKTDAFELPDNNWRLDNSRLYLTPVNPDHMWMNTKETKRNALVYRKQERLKPGQAISIRAHFVKNSQKYTKLGLVVEGEMFKITPGYSISLGVNTYDLDVGKINGDETTLTLVRGKEGKASTIYWHIDGAGILKKGAFQIDGLPTEARFGFCFNTGYKEQQKLVYLSDFRYGNMDLEDLADAPDAKLTFESILPKPGKNPVVLSLERKEGPLTEKELANLIEWALNEPGQYSNQDNRMLKGHRRMHRVYKLYDVTQDRRILDHLIEVADLALNSRNDRSALVGGQKLLTGKENGKWIGEVLPAWPHFGGWQVEDGEKLYYGDLGNKAVGVCYMALAARAIAESPEVWEETFKGETYLDRARLYVKESIYSVDKANIPLFVEPGTLELKYQFQRYEMGTHNLNIGGYIPFNRCWHLPVAFVSLCPAMEILDIEPEKAEFYDKITQTAINRWLKSMRHYEKDGYQLVDFPYVYPSYDTYKENPEKWDFMPDSFKGSRPEDLNHIGADLSQLFVFYFSDRYEVPEDCLKKLGDTLLVNAHKGDWFFARLMDGSGRGIREGQLTRSAYFLTHFQPKLKPLYWDNPHRTPGDLEAETLFVRLFTENQ